MNKEVKKTNNRPSYADLLARNEQQRKRIFTLTAKVKGLTLLTINTLHTEDRLLDTEKRLTENKRYLDALFAIFDNKKNKEPVRPLRKYDNFSKIIDNEIVKWEVPERPNIPLPNIKKMYMRPDRNVFVRVYRSMKKCISKQ